MFLENRNIISKIKTSKVTYYAALHVNDDVSGRFKGLNNGQGLYLHPNSLYTRREGSVETALVRRLV